MVKHVFWLMSSMTPEQLSRNHDLLELYLVKLARTDSSKYAEHVAYLRKRLPNEYRFKNIILNALYKTTRLQNAARKIQMQWRTCVNDPSYLVCKRRLMREFEEMV